MADQAGVDATDGDARPIRRGVWFGGGLLVGLAVGVAATLTVPGLLPEGDLDCVRPERVVWSQEGSGVSLEISYADEGTDGCDARVVFDDPAASSGRTR